MSKQKRKKAESLLTDYLTGNLHEQLDKRKHELRFPPKKSSVKDLREEPLEPMAHTDTQGSALENNVLTYVDDGTYTYLKALILRLEKCLKYIKYVDERDYRILELFYKDKKSWICISQTDGIYLSESQCRRRRNKSIKELSKWI